MQFSSGYKCPCKTALRPGVAAGLVESDSATEYPSVSTSEMSQLPSDRHKRAIRWLRNTFFPLKPFWEFIVAPLM